MFFLGGLLVPFIYPFLKQHIKGMVSMLTTNSITRIGNGEILSNPILKILDFKPTLEDRYFVLLLMEAIHCKAYFSSVISHHLK
jgi:hypothetical protein